MADEYTWWREALKGNAGPISADQPECGYFKMRSRKDGPWQPVAIFMHDGAMVARVGSERRDPVEIWTYCAKNPIDKDIAKAAFNAGRFPDEPEPLEQRSNMPADPFEALRVEIEDRAKQAEEWLAAHPEIATQTECDLARNMQAQLLTLGKQADKDREAEKRPHLDASRAVDAKFKPLTVAARDMADRLRSAFERFMRAEERRRQEEQRKKYEEERAAAEAERKRIEEEQAKKMRDDPVAALTSPEPELPELPPEPEPVKVQAGGGVGRKAGLKTVYVGVVEDYRKALEHFADHPDVKAVITKLVNAAVRTGKDTTNIPGVKVQEDRRAA